MVALLEGKTPQIQNRPVNLLSITTAVFSRGVVNPTLSLTGSPSELLPAEDRHRLQPRRWRLQPPGDELDVRDFIDSVVLFVGLY